MNPTVLILLCMKNLIIIKKPFTPVSKLILKRVKKPSNVLWHIIEDDEAQQIRFL